MEKRFNKGKFELFQSHVDELHGLMSNYISEVIEETELVISAYEKEGEVLYEELFDKLDRVCGNDNPIRLAVLNILPVETFTSHSYRDMLGTVSEVTNEEFEDVYSQVEDIARKLIDLNTQIEDVIRQVTPDRSLLFTKTFPKFPSQYLFFNICRALKDINHERKDLNCRFENISYRQWFRPINPLNVLIEQFRTGVIR